MLANVSRKFILAMFIALSATGLCLIGGISDTVYATIMGTLLTTYFTANVSQKVFVKQEPEKTDEKG